jgi:choline dehydrogenase-like flavoprotein
MDLGGQALAGDAGTPQVLVIGAGPTGMITACELLRRGVQVRVVDAAPDPVPYCKALLLWPRTIDVLAELGLADEVPRRGIRINAFRYYSSGRELIKVHFKPELASWALPQRSTEDMLRAKLVELGGRIERGVRLLALDRMDFSGDPAHSSGITPSWSIRTATSSDMSRRGWSAPMEPAVRCVLSWASGSVVPRTPAIFCSQMPISRAAWPMMRRITTNPRMAC